MSRSAARRHRGRHKPYNAVPASAVSALAEKRISELEALIPNPETRRALDHWRAKLDKPLFVYFIQEDAGPVKIGKAHDPIARLRNLQCGNPRQLYIRHVVLATVDLEEYLHSSWRPQAGVRGEWFGHGLEQIILALAEEACQRQMQDAEQDFPVHMIAEWAGSILSPYWLKEKAA